MLRRPAQTFSRPFLLVLCAWSCGSLATPVDADLFQLRLRYGVAIRNGVETDTGPGLSYSGVTPNDFAVQAWLYPLLGRRLGLVGAVQREAFSLIDDAGTRLTQGALLRTNVGLGGRVRLFQRLGLDLSASWGFSQAPVFGTLFPSFTAVGRHAVLLGARAVLDLGPVTLEGRFEYPIIVATPPGFRSTGIGVGGGLRVRLFNTGPLDWGAMGDVLWNSDTLSTDTLKASQSVVRAGLALDVQWREQVVVAVAPPSTGRLQVTTTLDGQPAALAVTLTTAAGPQSLTTAADGTVALELEPGPVSATATKDGFVEASASGSLAPGGALKLELALVKVVPKTGGLTVKVTARGATTAPEGAQVTVGELVVAVVDGVATFAELPPGPVSVAITAPGFNPGDEAANIVAGTTTTLEVSLVQLRKRVPAIVQGLVRSARDGTPVQASLTLDLKQTLQADTNGAFRVEVVGGSHTMLITAPGFQQQRKTIVVRDGDQAIFNVDLSPKK